MIKAKVFTEQGLPILLIGLTAANIASLHAGNALTIDTSRFGLPHIDLLITGQGHGQVAAVREPSDPVPLVMVNLHPDQTPEMITEHSAVRLDLDHLSVGPIRLLVFAAEDEHALTSLLGPFLGPQPTGERR
ncbi:hypothetical protein [Streptacidiphilus cavernicola]|uniref:Uncharacterized protein n=1 Tax=Streptacidiphilus cavernicola TaxID=3342716 RepID=A0ABV6VY01_9ACTN